MVRGIDEENKESVPAFDLGIRCIMEEGRWTIQEVLPVIGADRSDMSSLVGVYQDILATAIKYLAIKYLVKPAPSVGPKH